MAIGDGECLYVEWGLTGIVDAFHIDSDGSVTAIGSTRAEREPSTRHARRRLASGSVDRTVEYHSMAARAWLFGVEYERRSFC